MHTIDWIDVCMKAGQVRRFHIHPTIGQETVAEHTYGVAMLVLMLTNRKASAALLRAALYHDIPEIETSDVPFTVKASFPIVKCSLEVLEEEFLTKWDMIIDLNEADKLVLKWADMLQLLFYCKQQRELGNRGMNAVFARGVDFLNSLKPVEHGRELLQWLIENYHA